MKNKILPALILAAALSLSACGGKNPDVPYELRTDDLPSAITLSEPIYDTDDNGLTRIEMVLDNDSNSNYILRYRVQWVDAKGFSIPTVMSRWDTTVVQARQTQRIFSIAPSPKAVKAFISFSYED